MKNEIIEIKQQALAVDKQAQGLLVKNQGQYDDANIFLKSIKAIQQKIKETFEPIISKAFQAHKEAKAQETKLLEPLVRVEAIVKNKMLDFIREQEKIRQEVERKLQAEAERKRQEALAKAEKAREEGKEARAEKYEDKASQIVAPVLAPTVDKGGVSTRRLYSAQVYDLRALVEAVAANKAPLGLIEANMPALNAQARSLKESMKYPGVKLIVEDSLTSARR